jgi:hypothetical protein
MRAMLSSMEAWKDPKDFISVKWKVSVFWRSTIPGGFVNPVCVASASCSLGADCLEITS